MGEGVLGGDPALATLRDLLRRGTDGLRGLDDMLRRVREQRRQLRNSGRLDGTLEEVRRLLDMALGQERAALFPTHPTTPDCVRPRLDTLPSDTAHAVRQLSEYDWQSPGQGRRTSDPRAAASGGARQPIPRDEAGPSASATGPGEHAARQGHDVQPQRHARRPTLAANTRRNSSTSSCSSTATSSPTRRRTSKSSSTPSLGEPPQRSGSPCLDDAGTARRARQPDGIRARGHGPVGADVSPAKSSLLISPTRSRLERSRADAR